MSPNRPDRLPHSYPFRLVERAEIVDDRRFAVVLGTADGMLLADVAWPVTLVAEALAQAILVVKRPPAAADLKLVGLHKVRLLRPLSAGSRFEVEVEELASFPPLRRYGCRAREGGALAVTAEITVAG